MGRILEGARQRAGLTQDELWVCYRDNGGSAGRSAFIGYLRGVTEPQVTQYNIVAQILNERLKKTRSKPLLPEFDFDDLLEQ